MPVYRGTHIDHLDLFLRTPTGQLVTITLILGVFLAFGVAMAAIFAGSALTGVATWFVTREVVQGPMDRSNHRSISAYNEENSRRRGRPNLDEEL